MRSLSASGAFVSLSLTVIVASTGCDGLKKKGAADAGPTASAAPAASASAAAASAAKIPGAHTVDGVGDIPQWAPDKSRPAKCTPSAAAKAKLKSIEAGSDPALIAGTADATALMKEVGADECFATLKGLAEALNNGGYKRYGVKKFDEAGRFWRLALTVRPALLLARYNLACALGLLGKGKDAVTEILEIARAAKEGDASASNFLEKAKTDADLVSVREDPTFKEALRASQGGLVGPRKGSSEPEVGAKVIPLLPEEFKKIKDTNGVTGQPFITFKPGVVNIWTWKPNPNTEMFLTTITDDISMVGKPRGGDSPFFYGGIAVYRRDGEKFSLLLARKTGEVPPAVAAGKNNTVAYTFDTGCGTLSGVLSWNGKSIEVREKTCQDL